MLHVRGFTRTKPAGRGERELERERERAREGEGEGEIERQESRQRPGGGRPTRSGGEARPALSTPGAQASPVRDSTPPAARSTR